MDWEKTKVWRERLRAKVAAMRWPRIPPWAAIVGGAAVFIALLVAFWDWNILKRPLEGWASAAVGREVRIDGDVDVDLSWTSRVTVSGVSVANPDWAAGDMARIDRLAFDIQLVPLFSGGLIFPQVEIERPAIDLIREKDGRANWRFGEEGTGKPLDLPVIGRLLVTDGRIHVNDIKHAMVFDGTVESREGPNGESSRAFVLRGGGTLDNKPFTATMTGDSPLRAGIAHPYVFDAHLRLGANELAARGNIPRPFDLDAIVASIEVSGNDMADLYYVTSLTFPNTPPYRIVGRLTRNADVWRMERLTGRVGHSDLAGSLSVDATGDRPFLRAELASKRAELNDIAALFGARLGAHARVAAPHALPVSSSSSSPASRASGAAPAPETSSVYADTLSLLPDAPLDVARVRHMDARVHYTAAAIQAGSVPVKDLAVTVKLDHGVLTLDPASVRLALGRLSGRARLDARQNIPDVDIALTLTDARFEQFFRLAAGSDRPAAGELEARVRLHGKGLSVHRAVADASGNIALSVSRGEIRQSLAELLGINLLNGLGLMLTGDHSTTPLRCAVADFHADNGVLTARRFVIDTGVVLATGTGTANLKHETMDIRLEGHPKKFRLLHVMAPITIQGKWDHPHIGIDAGKAAAQVGAGGLLSLLSPLAAIVPFITTGSTKDVDCARLLAGGSVQSSVSD